MCFKIYFIFKVTYIFDYPIRIAMRLLNSSVHVKMNLLIEKNISSVHFIKLNNCIYFFCTDNICVTSCKTYV